MGILGPPVPKRMEIHELKKVTSWVLWTPFIVSVLAVISFAIVRLLIHLFTTNEIHLKRWTNFRNLLGVLTSGGEFYGVYSHQSIQQPTHYGGVQREQSIPGEGTIILDIDTHQSNINRDKDLFMMDRRIPAETKGSWYNIYLLLLPLQVAIITIVIVHNIYIENYYTESCDSFAAIANNLNESRYYDCKFNKLSEANSIILQKCNNTDHGNEPISCSTYYYNPLLSYIILTILNSLLLHLTLAKGIVRFIIVMRYIVHKYGKSCREKCPCNIHGAVIVCNGFILIMGIALLVYGVIGDDQIDADASTNIVLFAFIVIAISIALFQFGLLQSDLYTPFTRCSYTVIDDPKPLIDQTTNTNKNQQTTQNDQTSRNYFCRSITNPAVRNNYEEI